MPDSIARTKILLVSPLPPTVGGISRWAQGILESELPNQFDIAIVDTSPPPTESLSHGSRFDFRRARASFVILRNFLADLRAKRPSLVHVNTSYYWAFLRDGLIVWLASSFGARTVLHLHGGDFDVFYRKTFGPMRWFIRRTLRKADAVIAITRGMQVFLEQTIGAANIHYLPNFVNPERFSQTRKNRSTTLLRGDTRQVEVLFVGWVIEWKGIVELLDAMRRLPGAHVTLAGPVRADVVDRIRNQLEQLGEVATLCGSLPHADIVDLYARSDVFALPTHREGFPNVVLEAMAAGLPVVSTPVGAIPEIIRDGVDGFLVPVSDVAALEDRLQRLVADPALRSDMGESARRRVCEQFSVGYVVQQLVQCYSAVLSPSGNAPLAREARPSK